jgi:hypothetical protein
MSARRMGVGRIACTPTHAQIASSANPIQVRP